VVTFCRKPKQVTIKPTKSQKQIAFVCNTATTKPTKMERIFQPSHSEHIKCNFFVKSTFLQIFCRWNFTAHPQVKHSIEVSEKSVAE